MNGANSAGSGFGREVAMRLAEKGFLIEEENAGVDTAYGCEQASVVALLVVIDSGFDGLDRVL